MTNTSCWKCTRPAARVHFHQSVSKSTQVPKIYIYTSGKNPHQKYVQFKLSHWIVRYTRISPVAKIDLDFKNCLTIKSIHCSAWFYKCTFHKISTCQSWSLIKCLRFNSENYHYYHRHVSLTLVYKKYTKNTHAININWGNTAKPRQVSPKRLTKTVVPPGKVHGSS